MRVNQYGNYYYFLALSIISSFVLYLHEFFAVHNYVLELVWREDSGSAVLGLDRCFTKEKRVVASWILFWDKRKDIPGNSEKALRKAALDSNASSLTVDRLITSLTASGESDSMTCVSFAFWSRVSFKDCRFRSASVFSTRSVSRRSFSHLPMRMLIYRRVVFV